MPTDDELRDVLALKRTAVVGASTGHGKAAHDVPGFLQWVGDEVIPVNPNADEVLGRRAYDSLADVEEAVDVVQIFRPGAEVGEIVDRALDRETSRWSGCNPGSTTRRQPLAQSAVV